MLPTPAIAYSVSVDFKVILAEKAYESFQLRMVALTNLLYCRQFHVGMIVVVTADGNISNRFSLGKCSSFIAFYNLDIVIQIRCRTKRKPFNP